MIKIEKPYFLKEMFVSGANNLYNYYPEIDKLNVFPIPDGDTGTNMNLTVSNALLELNNLPENYSISELSKRFSYGLIMNARGNSGVIFSQIFKGISNAISATTKWINILVLKKMFKKAQETAYKAVMKPVEGTILTVIKDISNSLSSIEYKENNDFTIKDVFKIIVKEGNNSLKNTPNLLPVLKEVGVVDSGAFGLMKFLEGMQYYVEHQKVVKKVSKHKEILVTKNLKIDQKENFGYCTEAIVKINEEYKSQNFDVSNIRNVFKTQGNTSIIVVEDSGILKVHLHSLKPGNVLTFLQRFGEFNNIKIDNMSLQVKNAKHNSFSEKKKYIDKVSILAVVQTNKLAKYFNKELNITDIIVANEDFNISTQEFISAIKKMNSKHVIVLPNDSNSILSAQNAVKLLSNKQVGYVMQTKNIQEGIASSMMFNTLETAKKNISIMKNHLSNLISISIFKSLKDGKISGINIKKGEYVAAIGKKVIISNKSIIHTLKKAINSKVNKNSEMITIIKGINANQIDINLLTKYIDEDFDVELEIIDGEQSKYDYLIMIE